MTSAPQLQCSVGVVAWSHPCLPFSLPQAKLLHDVVDHLESIGFVTDTLSKGDTKFMVRPGGVLRGGCWVLFGVQWRYV